MALGIDFQKDFDAFWAAKRSQVGSKIVPKIDLGGVLGGSWWLFGGSWRPTPKNDVRYPFLVSLLGPSWGPLGRLGGLLGRLAVQDGTRIGKKSIPKSIEIWMPLGIGILSDLHNFWYQRGASWHQNRS